MKSKNKARCMLSRPQLDIIIAAIKFTLNSEDGRKYMEQCVPSSCTGNDKSIEEMFKPAVNLRNRLKRLRKHCTTEKVVYAGEFYFKSFDSEYLIYVYIECDSLNGKPVDIDEDNLKNSLVLTLHSEGIHICPQLRRASCYNAIDIEALKNERFEYYTLVMQKEFHITSHNATNGSKPKNHRCLVNVFREQNLQPKIFNKG